MQVGNPLQPTPRERGDPFEASGDVGIGYTRTDDSLSARPTLSVFLRAMPFPQTRLGTTAPRLVPAERRLNRWRWVDTGLLGDHLCCQRRGAVRPKGQFRRASSSRMITGTTMRRARGAGRGVHNDGIEVAMTTSTGAPRHIRWIRNTRTGLRSAWRLVSRCLVLIGHVSVYILVNANA